MRGAVLNFKQLLLQTRILLRAALCGIWMPLLGAPQEVAEEGRPDVPSGTSLLPAVSEMNGGDVCDSKGPPSAGHVSHPADG